MPDSDAESEWDSPEMRRACYQVGRAVLVAASKGRLCLHLPSFDAFNRALRTLKGEDHHDE